MQTSSHMDERKKLMLSHRCNSVEVRNDAGGILKEMKLLSLLSTISDN